MKIGGSRFFTRAALLMAGFAAGSLWTHGGGWILYGEADWFLVDHNDANRSFISKVVCPHIHDAQHYMAREIAHLFEHLDARFIDACVMAGSPHFASLSHYLLVIAVGLGFAGMAWRWRNRVDPFCALLLLALWLTSPPLWMGGTFMRSGHMLATALLAGLAMFLFHRRLQAEEGFKTRPVAEPVLVFTWSFLAAWSDRQGLFGIVAMAAISSLFMGRGWRYSLPMAAAVALHFIHWMWIGPRLIGLFTPFGDVDTPSNLMAVSGADGGLPAWRAVTQAVWSRGAEGGRLAIENLRGLLGSTPLFVALPAAAAALIVARWRTRVAFAFTLLSVGVMNAIMLRCAEPIQWPDMKGWIYYHIIGTTMIWLGLSAAVPGSKLAVVPWRCVLLLLTLCNLASMNEHVARMRAGHWIGFLQGKPFLISALDSIVSQGHPSKSTYNTLRLSRSNGWEDVMINPMERPGLNPLEFVESSHYVQFIKSRRGLEFRYGGRGRSDGK